MLWLAAVSLVAFFVSWWMTGKLVVWFQRVGILDQPSHRSSHTKVTPRGGGLGILAGIVVGWILCVAKSMTMPSPVFLSCLCGMAVLGFIDDRSGKFPVWIKFLGQIGIAVFFVVQMGVIGNLPLPAPCDLPLPWAGTLVSVVWILWIVNLYNFMDGIDGLAAIHGVLISFGLVFLGLGDLFVAMGLVIGFASLGFLIHNWQPAKIFMGDAGSHLLGFSFAGIPFLVEPAQRHFSSYAMVILLWFFLCDGTLTILRRLISGEEIWLAHRSHLYQRLVISGLSHRAVTTFLAILTSTLILLLIILPHTVFCQWFVLGIAAVLFSIYSLIAANKKKSIESPTIED